MGITDHNCQAIRSAFESWEQGDMRPFFGLVSADVRWTVIGSTPISGTYNGRSTFLEKAAGKLTARFAGPVTARIVDVRADGDKVFLQWEGSARTTDGRPYKQTYCWVLTMSDGEVVEVLAYLDTELVSAVLDI
jgi:ketosteroid isomerase-like protein